MFVKKVEKFMTGSIRVVSCRAGTPKAHQPSESSVQIRADRQHPILGNPFVLKNHKDPVERAEVIAKQEARISADMAVAGPISQELSRIAELVKAGQHVELVCWCAPRPCHADRYVEIIQAMAGISPAQSALF